MLYDAAGGEPLPLPAELRRLYGGPLAIGGQALYANFVQSIDGVVAIEAVASPGGLLSGRNEADRFVMGLLRACADVVLVGAGTLRGDPGHRWVPAAVDPDRAGAFAELRRLLGLDPEPGLAVLSASGDLDPAHPALVAGAVVLTTEAGADHFAPVAPDACGIVVLPGHGAVDVGDALATLRARGAGRVLSEAGPSVTGRLLAASVLDDIFITHSPVLVGGDRSRVRGLAGEAQLPGSPGPWAGLSSVRRHGDHLFLRYDLAAAAH
jgi:riboflavin biosynthesis pyrimidine reductase